MNAWKRMLCLVICLLTVLPFAVSGALAEETETAPFRGWTKADKYQYVYFGQYPETADGEVKPLLWRVLAAQENGEALLMTEYVIDMYPIIWVESKKDRENQNFRRITCIEESDLYTWMNSTMTETMLSEEEVAVLNNERGNLFVLNRSESCTPAYGFTKSVYSKQVTRICGATDYAKARGVYEDRRTRGATYWVNGLKSQNGYRMSIVGYNGHISFAGYSRQNVGIRPAALVKMDQVYFASGTGTKDDPYVVAVKNSAAN